MKVEVTQFKSQFHPFPKLADVALITLRIWTVVWEWEKVEGLLEEIQEGMVERIRLTAREKTDSCRNYAVQNVT